MFYFSDKQGFGTTFDNYIHSYSIENIENAKRVLNVNGKTRCTAWYASTITFKTLNHNISSSNEAFLNQNYDSHEYSATKYEGFGLTQRLSN